MSSIEEVLKIIHNKMLVLFYFICDFSGFYDDVSKTSDTAFSVESKLFVCIQGALSFELFTSYFWIFFHV